MNSNETIRKDMIGTIGKCEQNGKNCDYLCANMCRLFRVQLDPTHSPLKICDYIYTITYKGRP